MFKQAFEKYDWRSQSEVDIIEWVKHTVFCHECGDRNWRMEDKEDGTGRKVADNNPNGFFFVRYCPCRQRVQEAWEAEQEAFKVEQKQRKIDDLFRTSDMGERFQERTFKNFEKKRDYDAYAVTEEYAQNFAENKKKGEGLYIFGKTPGNGKTHLAGAIANELIRNKHEMVIMATLIDILCKIKKTFKDRNKSEAEITTPLKECDLLIIDDFGQAQSYPKDWRNEKVFEIINYRYEWKKPMIITSNKEPYEIEQIYGKPITSRIFEMCLQVQATGENYRESLARRIK